MTCTAFFGVLVFLCALLLEERSSSPRGSVLPFIIRVAKSISLVPFALFLPLPFLSPFFSLHAAALAQEMNLLFFSQAFLSFDRPAPYVAGVVGFFPWFAASANGSSGPRVSFSPPFLFPRRFVFDPTVCRKVKTLPSFLFSFARFSSDRRNITIRLTKQVSLPSLRLAPRQSSTRQGSSSFPLPFRKFPVFFVWRRREVTIRQRRDPLFLPFSFLPFLGPAIVEEDTKHLFVPPPFSLPPIDVLPDVTY